MPFVHITTWPAKNESEITRLQEDITFAVHKNTGAPLDKISVVISEIQPSRWADAGVPGNHKDFPEKSRRKNYEE
ncbi:tautomerase [Salmonella enterica subsp. enterica serovar Typhimurium]|uniref:2-hydroxymuconate tautomerase n=1 Tax=Enterobacteriaceae TaxID=543 RepID=UPI00032E9766|nr:MULTISPECIES: 2-hydroxymuconate tautomerase [Enterobacteriaceae]EBD1155425.1 tautomerase [Salmonella enterica subsp. enterica serovar Uganda]EBI0198251.1 tautomerase [Salmonella enterica subsp. enterica serovar Liverpool]ECU6888000.1 tautomerase [Salmonella enterica subsp. enterica serovar Muenster]EDW7034245.1 tautomerase [Salmonella enterica subsp. enterica serovar 4,[5],12:i:-]EEJ2831199.1 tautomerase [Salmonella enterica subsp. enterica serovar London]EGD1345437.1 tautomerase [Salmonel